MSEDPSTLEHALAAAEAARRAGRLAEAAGICERILVDHPVQPEALHVLGRVRVAQGDTAGGLMLVERAAHDRPDHAPYQNTLCAMYRAANRREESLHAGRRAVALAPRDAQVRFNLARTHVERLDLERAGRQLLQAITLQPEFAMAHLELAQVLLLRGEFGPGWREYEWRLRLPEAARATPPLAAPAWNGMRLRDGRVLLIGDQGFGDTLQFARFIPYVAQRCSEVVVGCDARLRRLLSGMSGVATCVERWEALPRIDTCAMLSSLPGLFGTTLESIPATVPYLAPDRDEALASAATLRALPGRGLRIGLAWAGRPTHPYDHLRSIRLREFAPLRDVAGTIWVSLQKDIPDLDRGAMGGDTPLHDLASDCRDFAETAALVSQLDLVISIDSAVAHLAGALGKPVWVLLPPVPDWRWLLERADSPWYPTMRLFRQNVGEGWREVIGRVRDALERRVQGTRGEQQSSAPA